MPNPNERAPMTAEMQDLINRLPVIRPAGMIPVPAWMRPPTEAQQLAPGPCGEENTALVATLRGQRDQAIELLETMLRYSDYGTTPIEEDNAVIDARAFLASLKR